MKALKEKSLKVGGIKSKRHESFAHVLYESTYCKKSFTLKYTRNKVGY